MVRFVATALLLLGSGVVAKRHVDSNVGQQTLRRRTSQFSRFLSSHRQRKQRTLVQLLAKPIQSFYVPLPEDSMLSHMISEIKVLNTGGPIYTMISTAISTDETVIWYDHWEDGFEGFITEPTQESTEIWGDGIAANGCAPHVEDCNDTNDVLNAGDTFVIESTVEVPVSARTTQDGAGNDIISIRFDGGDLIQSSFPIAVTRGAYPERPGSQLAGAVEVLDTDNWGTEFVSPTGPSLDRYLFQYNALFVMAGKDGATVTTPSGSITLSEGQGKRIHVDMGEQITSDKPIQVDLITGDKTSRFEMRWFSLLDFNDWSTEYVSPVGDTHGKTKMVLFNPSVSAIDVTMVYLDEDTKEQASKTIAVGAKKGVKTPVVPTGSGAYLKADSKFVALSITDTALTAGDGTADFWFTFGQWFDWGFPVMPKDKLTPQVLVGLGYGCTDNVCGGLEERSLVWVTPTEDATIRVSRNNDNNYIDYNVTQWESIKFEDDGDQDMSGAFMYAYSPTTGSPVSIAAAWGQDPARSKANQSISLDLGTVIPPFNNVEATKFTNKPTVEVGDELTYTVRVTNVGRTALAAGSMTVVDTLDDNVAYVEGSTSFVVGKPGALCDPFPIADDTVGSTAFPLDEGGYLIQAEVLGPGVVADVTFKVRVNGHHNIDGTEKVFNNGLIKRGLSDIPFTLATPVTYTPGISVTNEVYDTEDASGCDEAVETVTGYNETAVVYCFKITNTGNTPLSSININNEDLSFQELDNSILQPGDSRLITVTSEISGTLTNTVEVTGNPVDSEGNDIDADDVTDSDDSNVIAVADRSTRNGAKPPYSPPEDPVPNNCVQDAYEDNGKDTEVVCTNSEVSVASATSEVAACSVGEKITVSVDANIFIQTARENFGWYVAKDNGDALTGTCAVNGLQEGLEYNVTLADGSSSDENIVTWSMAATPDPCGDILISAEDGGYINTPLLVEEELTCADDNGDGKLDITVCFVWKGLLQVGFCTLLNSPYPDTVGRLPDIIPGSDDQCNCQTIDLSTVTVDKPTQAC